MGARLIEQRQQNRFLHVQAIFGLFENDGAWRIHDGFADFRGAVGRKTVHEDGVGRGMGEERVVDLVIGKGGTAHRCFVLLAHAGPRICVDRLRTGDCFGGRAQDFDFAARFAHHALGFGDDIRIGLVARGRRYANVGAGARADAEQRVTGVIAIADVGDFQAAQISEAFFEREEIGERLAGMITIGKRVDHWNAGVGGQLLEGFLLENACDDAGDPALEAFRDVRDGFAFAEMRDGVIEKYGRAPQAGDADFESDARAQRRLFENHREETTGERAAITVGMRFHVRGELQEVADLRGAPFHSGEEVVGQSDVCGGSGRVHVCLYLAAARAMGCAFDRAFWVELGFVACFRAFSNLLRNSATSLRRMMKGGSRRRICSWVQLMSRPPRRASVTIGAPSIARSTPRIRPSPRTSRMKSKRAASFSIPWRSSEPRSRMFASRFESSTTFRNSSAVAQMSGPPPKVVPWSPGTNAAANVSLAMMAPRGNPPARGLATARISGRDENFWYAKLRPVRPRPH